MPPKDLSFELLVEIFLRLPVKYLVRCALVCKLWCFIIKSPYFLTAQVNYLKDIKANDKLLLLKADIYSILSDITFAEVKTTNHPFPVKPGRELILGSCNGLLCLALRFFSHWLVILWNPSVRKCKIIDEIRDHWSDRERSDEWGRTGTDYALGWHDTSNDFRVVKVVNRGIRREVSVYNLETEAWHLYGGESVPNVMFGWKYCVVKGAIHWIYLANLLQEMAFGISAFSLEDESFKEMMLPPEFNVMSDMYKYNNGSIVELSGSIAFISYCEPLFKDGNDCSVWLMMEYGNAESWIKLFTFETTEVIERPLGFTKAGRFICKLKREMPLLVSCNFESCQLEDFGGELPCGVVVDFMETAFLL